MPLRLSRLSRPSRLLAAPAALALGLALAACGSAGGNDDDGGAD